MYLLDTSILSEFIKRRPNPRVVARAASLPATSLFTSTVCQMELRNGAMRREDGAVFWARIEREILSRVRIEPFDEEAARRSGDILADLDARGLPVGVEDAQIAGTALARGLVVATANVRHFSRIGGLGVEDWTRA